MIRPVWDRVLLLSKRSVSLTNRFFNRRLVNNIEMNRDRPVIVLKIDWYLISVGYDNTFSNLVPVISVCFIGASGFVTRSEDIV